MARLATLTPQQVRVLMMLSEGLLNKQIAYELERLGGDGEGARLRDPAEARRREPHAGGDRRGQDRSRPVAAGRVGRSTEFLLRRRHPLHAPLRQQRAQRRRLDRLVEHLHVLASRASSRTAGDAVGGDQDGRQIGAEAPAQRGDGIDAVAVVEMIVDQQAVRRICRGSRSPSSAVARSGALSTWQPQPPSSVSMPSRMAARCRCKARRCRQAGSRSALRRLRAARAGGSAGAKRQLDRETRAAADDRDDLDLVVEHARDALDDRESEPEAARDLGALIEPMEFLEDHRAASRAECRGRCRRRRCAIARRGAGSRPARGPSACI